MTGVESIAQTVCAICGDESAADLCAICALDTGVKHPALWDAVRLREFNRQQAAKMEAHHRDYTLTRKLVADLRQAAAPALGDKLSDLSQRIVTLLAHGPQTLEQMESTLGCDREALRARLKTLAQGGRVQNVSYGTWQLRPRVVFRKGESNQAVLATLSAQPMTTADVSRVTRISRANTHRILKRLARLGQARKTADGWVKAKEQGA